MKTRCSIIAAIAAAAAATCAQADTVNLQYVGLGANRSVKATIGSSTFNVHAGQLKHAFSGGTGVAAGLTGTLLTFCTDLTESVSSSGTLYTVAPIANLPQTTGWPAMGSTRAQGVYNLYAAAGGAQFASNNDYAAAFQIALWEVVYDYNGTLASLSLTNGNFKAKNTDGSALINAIATNVTSLFTSLVNNGLAPQTGLIGLTSDGAQDQIVQVVPLPETAGLGMVGLAVAAYTRKKLRGSTTPR